MSKLLFRVKHLEALFYGGAAAALPERSTARRADVSDALVRRYVREIASDKAEALAGLSAFMFAGLGGAARAGEIDRDAFVRIAREAGAAAPGAVFQPYADETSVLLAAHMIETATGDVYRAALRQATHPQLAKLVADMAAESTYHGGLIVSTLHGRGLMQDGLRAQIEAIPEAISRLAGELHSGSSHASLRLFLPDLKVSGPPAAG